MKVLVIIPTYARIPFLNRAVASFLGQNHKDKELVIINDDINVTLACDEPSVHCINLTKKVLVGDKRNIGVCLGDYDLYMPLDDDDIFLPQRITNHVNKHLANPELDLYRNGLSYIIYGDKFSTCSGPPNAISFTKRGWLKAGGYSLRSNCGEDQHFDESVENKENVDNLNEIDFVYNFGGINYHLSNSRDDSLYNVAHKQLVDLNILGKTYNIVPDYKEYNNFLELDRLYKENNKEITVKHLSLGKIEIVK